MLTVLHDRSPAHLRHALDHEGAPTEARVLGDALHLSVLQPHLFPLKYAVAPKVDGRTKDGKAALAKFREENPGKVELKPDEYERCLRMSESVWKHRAARELLEQSGPIELSAVFDHSASGLRCKMRADKLAMFGGLLAVVDLKTTPDASPREFAKSIYRYGYYRQGAFYLGGFSALAKKLLALTGAAPPERFITIAIEKDEPYPVAVYDLSDEALSLGRQDLGPLVRRYRSCRESRQWSGYGEDVRPISLPPYAWKE